MIESRDIALNKLEKELRIEIETLKNIIKDLGLKQHANHSESGNNFAKFVEGHREKLIEDWSQCKFIFCKNIYNLVYTKEHK